MKKIFGILGTTAILLSTMAGNVFAKENTTKVDKPTFSVHVEAFLVVDNVTNNSDGTVNFNGVFQTISGTGANSFDTELFVDGLKNGSHVVNEYLYSPNNKRIDFSKSGFYGSGNFVKVNWSNGQLNQTGTYSIRGYIDGHYVAYITFTVE